jgi:hypothetical protein
MTREGFDSPFFRVYFNKQEILEAGERFSYVYAEEEDDECTIIVRLEKPNDIDLPQYQEGAELQVTWGYVGGESTTRLVYVDNSVPEYTKDNISLTLNCSDKASTMKGATERTIYKDHGFIGVVADKATKHGLGVKVETSDYDGIILEPLTDALGKQESRDQFIKRLNKLRFDRDFKKQQEEYRKNPGKQMQDIKNIIPENNEYLNIKAEVQKEYDEGIIDIGNVEDETNRRWNFKKLIAGFTFAGDNNLTQAGKSDKQFVNDLGKRTRGGQTIVEGRDDLLIIKKRNYNQPPYRTYEYGGSDGELVAFRPETKNKQSKGAASNMTFGGWNPALKNYFMSSVDPTNPQNDPALASALKIISQDRAIIKAGGGKTVVETRILSKEVSNFPTLPHTGANQPVFDNTKLKGGIVKVPFNITVEDQVSALEKSVATFVDKVQAQQKDLYNSLGINPDASLTQASNMREGNELKMNPASFSIWGDPNAKTGIIIGISGAGRKHSGNYYVIKCAHVIDKGTGYQVEYEGAKHGHNIVSGKDYVKAEAIGRKPNNRKHNPTKTPKTKTIKIQTNAPTKANKKN